MAHDDFLITANIERFKQKLKDSRDEGKRKILNELLNRERRRLAAAQPGI